MQTYLTLMKLLCCLLFRVVKVKCTNCDSPTVYSTYCKEHLIEHLIATVKKTIEDYSLFSHDDEIVCATSGGKDSLTLVDVLSHLNYNVTALCIDEGIHNYREHTIVDLKKFCKERNVNLRIVSFKDNFNGTLDEYTAANDVTPCRVCGVFRRKLLNKYAYGTLATGHNLDDELQNIMMNFWRGNIELAARLGPRSGVSKREGFVPRVKPLYFIPEKMVRVYAILRGFDVHFTECPHARDSFRHQIGNILNKWESDESGVKRHIMDSFLEILPKLKEKYADATTEICPECNGPSAGGVCRACSYASTLKL